eukprot:gene594-3908_t
MYGRGFPPGSAQYPPSSAAFPPASQAPNVFSNQSAGPYQQQHQQHPGPYYQAPAGAGPYHQGPYAQPQPHTAPPPGPYSHHPPPPQHGYGHHPPPPASHPPTYGHQHPGYGQHVPPPPSQPGYSQHPARAVQPGYAHHAPPPHQPGYGHHAPPPPQPGYAHHAPPPHQPGYDPHAPPPASQPGYAHHPPPASQPPAYGQHPQEPQQAYAQQQPPQQYNQQPPSPAAIQPGQGGPLPTLSQPQQLHDYNQQQAPPTSQEQQFPPAQSQPATDTQVQVQEQANEEQPPSTEQPPEEEDDEASELLSDVQALKLEAEFHPTVVPYPDFDAEADAAALRKAMKGFGTDEKTIIEILSTRSAEQRLQIKLMFKTMYGKCLIQNLKSETSGNFQSLVASLCFNRPQFAARCLRRAMKGLGTDERALIEIICTSNNAEIREIKAAFAEKYGRDLEKDVVSETSGHFKRLLVSCLQANRDESDEVDLDKAKREAEELYKAGEKRWGTDESKFNQILALRSFPQLRAMFKEYRKISSYDIVRSIEREMRGDLRNAFKAVVMCVNRRAEYFADRLHQTMKGMGTDDDSLIRIVVSRSEVDMVEIKEAFFDKYHKSLAKMIKDDTSGHYRRLLIALVKEG